MDGGAGLAASQHLMKSAQRSTSLLAVVFAAAASACTGNDVPVCDEANYDACTSCTRDSDCAGASQRGEVCAPDMQCWPPDMLRTVTVTWTIAGQPANATTCANLPSELGVMFDNAVSLKPDTLDSPAVPCALGMLVQDRVNPDLGKVIIGGDGRLLSETPSWSSDTSVSFDLPSS
jgi:hypothetical protein